ncbi:hypothetical protein Leryth_009214 [Lithospermum erythrorhizon]|nr:hypothetical protein Leryth_009214 [Lithospermum erythrorhizon]
MVPQQGSSKEHRPMVPKMEVKKSRDVISLRQQLRDCVSQPKDVVSVTNEAQEDTSITAPSEWCSSVDNLEGGTQAFNTNGNQLISFTEHRSNETVASLPVESQHVPLVEGQKKVHFVSDEKNPIYHDMELGGGTTIPSQDLKLQSLQSAEVDPNLRYEFGTSSSTSRNMSNQLHNFMNFVQNDMNQPITQSTVGSYCTTTTLINSSSAPMISSTTFCSQPQLTSSSYLDAESPIEAEMKVRLVDDKDVLQAVPEIQVGNSVHASSSVPGNELDGISADHIKEPESNALRECPISKDNAPGHSDQGHNSDKQSDVPLSDAPLPDGKSETSKPGKKEKGASCKAGSTSRKKNYDPDLFFKVNGKLYQKLGKIGSGGSSEVHKVITNDCTIYALKKIKLKGRDYATAHGFYQEIEYLNKLKGKNNIIQLIDYEVTDKNLLREIINGSISNKDGRVRDDGYIYMVLEYGEIDLAHMLAQKFKELDNTDTIIDENWLRFYWQQILSAVNTIHEERIVHSDLKPANFLLVRGSLKLIDFGIAKAIMSDTTNIQRDSQVGTLSYMSPEAFMCNDTDENGKMIKCGRSSDIWSLGCILYQMVYGRTPFAEYKTFWAKYKVITDHNHDIIYEPLSNPWLLDIMKKCLQWDRNKRWRIPELLQHPFLVPHIPTQMASPPHDQHYNLLQLLAKSCENDEESSLLCSQIQEMLTDPRPSLHRRSLSSRDEQCQLLEQLSNACIQLQRKLRRM